MSDQNVDKLSAATGNPGKFQMLKIIWIDRYQLYAMLSNHLTMIFYAAKTEHHCQ